MAVCGGIDDSDDDAPLSRKRPKLSRAITNEKEAEDRISALSNSLLIRILSFLGTKEVVRTCLLSKRWEFVWTDLSEVDLRETSYNAAKIRRFVDWVGRMLAMCRNLNKFAVSLSYKKCFASNVNFWVYFAIKNKVKDITLRFNHRTESYELPQVLYSYSSLTNLNVYTCVIAPRGIISWRSLKRLSIHGAKLLDCVMEKILSSCPFLRVLHLESCSGLNYLNIDSPNLATLVLEEYDPYEETFLDISAPYLRVLSILRDYTVQFRLRNVSAVVRANLDLQGLSPREISTVNLMKHNFKSLQYVQILELGPDCVELVTVLEVEGWKLPLYTQLRYLTLNVWRHEMSFPGILSILRSSPNLDTLLIRASWNSDEETMDLLDEYDIRLKFCNMELVASHLKTVKITHFTEDDLAAEPMQTLVQILLKSAKILKKMVISVKEVPFVSASSSTSIDSTNLTKRLLTFPRASRKAVVEVNY